MSDIHTLTGNLRDVVPGGVSTAYGAYIETNVPDDEALVGTGTDGGIAPSNVGRIPLAADAFTLQLLATDSTDLNVMPNTLRYRVHVEYGKPGQKGIFDWYSAWFELTGDANLKTIIGTLELAPASTVADQLAARISALEAGGGGGGGSSAVILSAGGVITLNDTLADGATLFYRFAGAATVDGIDLPAGVYAFLADPESDSGWSYWTINPPAELPVPDEGGGGDPGDPIETTPQQPTWNDSLRNYVIPNTLGVQYKKAGVNIAAGTYSTDSPTALEPVTITAVEKPGYFFPDGVATSWTHTYPAVTAWAQSFADTFLTPLGRITERAGCTITNGASGADDIVTEASGTFLTGNTSVVINNPVEAAKHDITFDYDLSEASVGNDRFFVDIARAVQPHRHMLRRFSSTAVQLETWGENTLASDLHFVNTLPLVGTFRAESDGLYVFAYVDGVKIAQGPHHPSLTGGYVPTVSSLIARGEPVNIQKTRFKNVVMRTKA